jgi:hypothetical protein
MTLIIIATILAIACVCVAFVAMLRWRQGKE